MSDTTPRTPGNEAPAAAADSSTESSAPSAPSARATARAEAHAAAEQAEARRVSSAVAMNRGFGDAMGRGLELALTLLVFGAVGWGIDRLAGTSPVFTIALSGIGFAGISVKLWLGYDLDMRKLESEAVWSREADGTVAPNLAPQPVEAPKQTVEL